MNILLYPHILKKCKLFELCLSDDDDIDNIVYKDCVKNFNFYCKQNNITINCLLSIIQNNETNKPIQINDTAKITNIWNLLYEYQYENIMSLYEQFISDNPEYEEYIKNKNDFN